MYPPWAPSLFPLLELLARGVPISPLLLLFPGFSQEFLKFATIEAIQRTEIFEYCQMLGRPKSFIPSFQVTEPRGDRQLSCGQPGFQLCRLVPDTSGQVIAYIFPALVWEGLGPPPPPHLTLHPPPPRTWKVGVLQYESKTLRSSLLGALASLRAHGNLATLLPLPSGYFCCLGLFSPTVPFISSALTAILCNRQLSLFSWEPPSCSVLGPSTLSSLSGLKLSKQQHTARLCSLS